MRLINLTPHKISVYAGRERVLEIPPSGTVARVEQSYDSAEPLRVDGVEVPVAVSRYGHTEGLPEPQDGVGYIVSIVVAQAHPERTDLYVPDTGEGAVRDPEGRILGTRRLLRVGREAQRLPSRV